MLPATTPTCRFVMLICCILYFSSLTAQQTNDLVYRHSGFGILNKKYFLNDAKISKRNVAELLERENKEAYTVFKSARSNAASGILIMIPAGVMLIVGAESYVLSSWRGVTEKPGLLIAGAAGVAGALALVIIANNKFKSAGDIYSYTTSSTGKMHLNFGLTPSGGMGLTVSL